MGQWNIARLEVAKLEKCDDALRDTVDVNGIRAVMKIPDCTVIAKEVALVVVKPFSNTSLELVGPQASVNLLQRAQVVSGVEVIDPFLC